MVQKEIIDRLYEAASIRRWNDHVRPEEFTELDKQAHKMIIAYVLAMSEGYRRDLDGVFSWVRLIEGGIFEFLHRVLLTDIKPPVFHRMMAEKGPELNRWVLEKLKPELEGLPASFTDHFSAYLLDPDFSRTEKRILKAAHYLATNWEFQIIYSACPYIYGIENTRAEIENQLEDHYDLKGVQKIWLGKKSFGFVDLCGQLRFQRRWSQSPRLPETSVLGHMLIVAILTYWCSLELDACSRRLRNNFFAGLFHDLPEVLTRDITSPVKGAVEGLEDIIKEYENIQIESRLLPLLPESWHREIRYFIQNEFANRVIVDGEDRTGLTVEEINRDYNRAEAEPVDGKLLRACDHLAAFIEASKSIDHGVTSKHLEDGKARLLEVYQGRFVSSIDFGQLFADFS